MQHYVPPNVFFQQWLQLVEFASDWSVWQSGSIHRHNQPNSMNLCTLLVSPPHILELVDEIPIVESSCTSWKSSILLSQLAVTPDIWGSDAIDSRYTVLQEKKKVGIWMCYQNQWPHVAYRRFAIQVRFFAWHRYNSPGHHFRGTERI